MLDVCRELIGLIIKFFDLCADLLEFGSELSDGKFYFLHLLHSRIDELIIRNCNKQIRNNAE